VAFPIAVIGYGNPARGDDGFGWQAARSLDEELGPRNDVAIITCHQLTPDLAAAVGPVSAILFLDVSLHVPAGEVISQVISPGGSAPLSFSHHLTPAQFLCFVTALNGVCPSGVAISVGGRSFGYEERLSLAVRKALPVAVDLSKETILRFGAGVRKKDTLHRDCAAVV
jgi:hydrogenase maturation protease